MAAKNHDDLVISMMTLAMRTTVTFSQKNMMVAKMMMAMASEKTRKPSSDAQDWKIVLELHISYV